MTLLTLALAQAAARDTLLVMAQPEGWQRWVSVLASIATIVIAVALIAIALALLAAAWQSRKIYGRVRAVLDRVHGDLRPAIGHATDVAENVNYMSTAIRADVDEFRATLARAQQKLDRAAGTTEQRIRQFNALLKLVQEEAEELFLDTASTLHGVRAGARALREGSDEEIDWDAVDEGHTRVRPEPSPRRHP